MSAVNKDSNFVKMPEYMFVTFSFKGLKMSLKQGLPSWLARAKTICNWFELVSCVMEFGKRGTNPHIHMVFKVPEEWLEKSRRTLRRKIAYEMYKIQDVNQKRMYVKAVENLENMGNIANGYHMKESEYMRICCDKKLLEAVAGAEKDAQSLEQYLVRFRCANALLTNEESEMKRLYTEKEFFYVDSQQKHYVYPTAFPIEEIRTDFCAFLRVSANLWEFWKFLNDEEKLLVEKSDLPKKVPNS